MHLLQRIRTCLCLGWLGSALLGLGGGSSSATAAARFEGDYLIDVWQTDQGLPQGTVTSMVQSPEGYLWLGTFNGLVRFDGVQFRVLNPANTPGLESARIVQLLLDKAGALWVGTEEGQLYRYLRGEFTEFFPPSLGSTARLARQLAQDSAAGIWVLNYESSIARLNGEKFASAPHRDPLSEVEDGFESLAADAAGEVWAATRQRVCRWRKDAFETVWPASRGPEIRALAAARAGGIWAACGQSNQLVLRRITDSGSVAAEWGPFPWGGRPVYSLLEDRAGRVWAGMLGGGIYRCDPEGGRLEITEQQGLPNNFVRSLMEDREGNIWVGLQGGGLARLKPALFRRLTRQEGLSADQVLSVTEGEPGELWVATNGEWLNRVRNGQVEVYDESRGLDNSSVWSVFRDREQNIWAGTWGGGLYRLEGQRFERFSVPGFPAVLARGAPLGPIVLGLFQDSEGALWLGQHSYGTVTRLLEGVPIMLNVSDAPSNFDIRVIAEDAAGAVWLGTHGSGLFRYQAGTFTHFGRKEGLGSEFVWALRPDADGTLWIGTYLGGLGCWRGGRIQTLTMEQGLPSDVVGQLLDDEAGNLWCGSYGGVFKVPKKELIAATEGRIGRIRPHLYTKSDGLPSIECTGGFQPSACKTREGLLCFPTMKGLAILDPRQGVSNAIPPQVLVESVIVDGRVVWDSLGADPGNAPPVVEIQPGPGRIEIHYTGLSLAAPLQLGFRRQLQGWDPDWVEAGGQRSVDYSHLPPGTYRLMVSARTGDNVWSERHGTVSLKVLPFYWQTRWFKASAVAASILAVALVAGLIVGRRDARRMAVVEQQRAIQGERLRIAQDIHDDLGARLTEITLLSELASGETPENLPVQSDMRQIATKARDLTRSVDEIVWAVDPSNDNLESLATYACGYAEDYLRPAQIRCLFTLPPQIPKLPISAERRHELFMAFKESLTNIVRHSGAREVNVRMSQEGTRVIWSVADDGRGWPESGTGARNRNGLENMSRRLRRIGGTCRIQNSPGCGVTVEFQFDLQGPILGKGA